MKEVVLLGKGDLFINIADWLYYNDYAIKAVAPVIPEPQSCPSVKTWARNKNIKIIESGNYKDIKGEINLCISVFYEKIIKQEFIDRCKKIINLHNSPLPKYRGVRPINWALKNGEKTHGVTIHEISEGIDDGPIYGQITYPIYPEIEEVKDVYEKSKKYGFNLFKEVIRVIDDIKPYPQDESQDTYYSNKDIKKLGDRSDFTR